MTVVITTVTNNGLCMASSEGGGSMAGVCACTYVPCSASEAKPASSASCSLHRIAVDERRGSWSCGCADRVKDFLQGRKCGTTFERHCHERKRAQIQVNDLRSKRSHMEVSAHYKVRIS